MGKSAENISRVRMDETANRLVQTVLSVLPICAVVIGLLFQQQQGWSYIYVIVVIWLSIFVLIISALINLQVQRSADTFTKSENDKLYLKYKTGIVMFTVGMFLLLIAPAGFLVNVLFIQEPSLVITPTRNEILFRSSPLTAVEHFSIELTYQGKYPSNIAIQIVTDLPTTCMTFSPDVSSLYMKDQESKILGITATKSNSCTRGDYLLIVETIYDRKILERKSIAIIIR